MFTKVLGAFLVCGAGGYAGFSASARLSARVQTVGDMIKALEFMQNEITYTKTSMAGIVQSLANTAQGGAKYFFERLGESMNRLWETGFGSLWQECVQVQRHINQSDKNILIELGHVLGRYDAEIEAKNISAAMNALDFNWQSAKQEQKKYAKMYRAFGLAFGLFVAILLF